MRIFGFKNRQISKRYQINQNCKGPILSGYIFLALAKSRESYNDKISFVKLFCADGYYTGGLDTIGQQV
ncbi:MAG: hypothetical protein ACP5Q5_10225 [Brevinematia bacterium]